MRRPLFLPWLHRHLDEEGGNGGSQTKIRFSLWSLLFQRSCPGKRVLGARPIFRCANTLNELQAKATDTDRALAFRSTSATVTLIQKGSWKGSR